MTVTEFAALYLFIYLFYIYIYTTSEKQVNNQSYGVLDRYGIYIYITNLVCYTYFHWFFNPECRHIFVKQTGYIFQSPKND